MAIISRAARTSGGQPSAELIDVQAAYSGTGFWADGHDGKPVVSGAAPLEDGDTLIIGAGNVTWATQFTISRAIKVIGQGAATVINGSNGAFILNISPQPAGAGFNTWLGGMVLSVLGKRSIFINGFNFDSPHRGFRIHHIRFLRPGTEFIFQFNDGLVGVVDHCSMLKADIVPGGETFFGQHIRVPATIGGATSEQGHGSWARARDLQKMIYFEDCVTGHQFDGDRGCRMTTRHCSAQRLTGQGHITHGLDSSGPGRSTFTQDDYNNHWVNPVGQNGLFVGFRGGNGRVFNNDATGTYSSGSRKTLQLFNYRIGGNPMWQWTSPETGGGAADGTCVFDTNDRAAHGTINPVGRICQPNSDITTPKTNAPCLPDPSNSTAKWQGAVYASMVYDGADTGNVGFGKVISFPHTALFPATPLDFWKFFCLRNLSIITLPLGSKPANLCHCLIDGSRDLGNGRTELTLISQGTAVDNPPGVNTFFYINNGHNCEIRRVIKAIDCTTAGQGEALTGGEIGQQRLVSTGLVGPLNQTSEKIHFWGNRNRPNDTTAFSSITYNQADWAMGVGPVGSLAQMTCSSTDQSADIVLAPATDMNWDANVTGTEANYIGADDEVRATFFPGLAQDDLYYARYQRAGTGGAEYPHWIVRDALPGGVITPTPTITNSQTQFTFTKGTAADCNANPKVNCFAVTVSNFTGTPTLSVVSGALPANVGFTGLNVSGTAGTATVQDYDFTLRATSGAQTADKAFKITVVTGVTPPPSNVAVTKPLNGAIFTAPATITLESTATTSGGASLSTMQYYHGGSNLIATINATTAQAPYSFDWTGVAAGSYSLTVKATDSLGGVTTSSGTVSVSVGSIVTLPAPTIIVTSGQPVLPAVSTKKILHWQVFSNSGSISSVVTNHVYVDTLPFDGLFMKFTDYQDCLGPTYVANYNTLYGQIGSIKNVLLSLTHNYVTVLVGNSGMVDPFDDWTQTQTNFVILAQVCRDAGLEGFVFDNEEYNVHMWTYPGDLKYGSTKTALEYKDQWRLRGTQVMQAIIAEWPAAKVLVTLGPNRSVTAVPAGAMFQGDPNWMGGYFFMGLFAGAPTGNHVISGGELYYNRTVTQFSNWKNFLDTIYTQNATLMPSNLNTTWNANDDLSFGIYDQDAVGSPAMSPSVLQQTIINAMPYADELIWNYSETLDWLTPGAGSAGAWQDAVRAARTTLGI